MLHEKNTLLPAGCRYPARLVEGLRQSADLAAAGDDLAHAPTSLAWLGRAFQPAPASLSGLGNGSPAGGWVGGWPAGEGGREGREGRVARGRAGLRELLRGRGGGWGVEGSHSQSLSKCGGEARVGAPAPFRSPSPPPTNSSERSSACVRTHISACSACSAWQALPGAGGLLFSVPHALEEHVPALAGPLPVESAGGGSVSLTSLAGRRDAVQALHLAR